MKRLAFVITALLSPAASALAQTAGISGQVVLADGGQPLGYTVVSNGERQLLTRAAQAARLQRFPNVPEQDDALEVPLQKREEAQELAVIVAG